MKGKLLKLALGGAAVTAALAAAAYYGIFYLDPRPVDTTAARVYAEDPYRVDYCNQAELDGSGLTADEIPKAFTPDCHTDQWPAPILAGCTEPLPPEAADLRGLWRTEDGQVGHVERIEQCGNRVVVSGRRFIHDFRTTGTLDAGADDINPRDCTRVRAAIEWNEDEVLEFRPWGLVKLVTRRLEDGGTLIWEYPGQPVSRLQRICRLPADGPENTTR